MIFEKDFQEFIELLNRYNVKYMIVGAHALALHGKPRLQATWIFGSSQVGTMPIK
jgi:hypothetical protein